MKFSYLTIFQCCTFCKIILFVLCSKVMTFSLFKMNILPSHINVTSILFMIVPGNSWDITLLNDLDLGKLHNHILNTWFFSYQLFLFALLKMITKCIWSQSSLISFSFLLSDVGLAHIMWDAWSRIQARIAVFLQWQLCSCLWPAIVSVSTLFHFKNLVNTVSIKVLDNQFTYA